MRVGWLGMIIFSYLFLGGVDGLFQQGQQRGAILWLQAHEQVSNVQ